jgi:MFS family permease
VNDRAAAPLFTPAFVLLLVTQASFGFAFSVYFLLPKYLVDALHASAAEIGQVTAVAAVAGVVAVPFIGRLLDGSRRRVWMIAGAALMSLSSLPFMLLETVSPLIYVLRALQGVAFTLFTNAGGTLAAELSPPARLGQAIGFYGLAMLVTNALAPAVAEPLAAAQGWPAVFVLAAAACAVAMVLSFWVREVQPPRSEGAPPSLPLFDRRAIVVLYVIAVVGAAFGSVITFTQPLALELGMREVRALFIGYTAAATVVRIGLSNLADRFGRQRIALFAMVLYTGVVFASAALERGWLGAIGMGLGTAHGLLYPALNALAIEHAGRRRGTMMTFFTGAFSAGFAISVFALGRIAQDFGYRSVFIVSGVLASTALVALLRLPVRPESTRADARAA